MKPGERKRFVIGAIIAIALAIGLWVGLRWIAPISTPRHDKRVVTAPSPSAPQTRPAVSPASTAGVISTPSTQEEREGTINRLEATPIVFFGKVVDQYQLPVAGAQVTYTVHHLSFAGNSPIEGPVTDKNGGFEIRTRGPSITVSVSHPEFYKGDAAERQVDYGRATTAPPYSPQPTPENPTLFVLVRKGKTENLIQVPSKEIRLPIDGRPVEISLGEHSSIVTMRLNSSSAALKPNEFRHFNWSFALAVPNGGLIERLNSLDFQAPETGYLSTVDIQMPSDERLWSSRINKDYFVHFADGKYGRFQITVSGETGFCRFESYLNPSGSRNLEVDPAKLVRAASSR